MYQSKVKAEKERLMEMNIKGINYSICSDCEERSNIVKYIQSLEKENASIKNDVVNLSSQVASYMDKVSRRNMQIKELKKKLFIKLEDIHELEVDD